MYVCICNAITEDHLKEIIKDNKCASIDDLQKFGVADNCFKCYYEIREMFDDVDDLSKKDNM